MSLIGSSADLGDNVRRGAERGRDISPLEHDPVLRWCRSHLLIHAIVARQRGRPIPDDLQLLGAAHRVPFVLCHDADEIAAAYDPSALNGTNGCFIDAHYLGASTIGALAARPHDAAVQQARHAHVLHVDVFAADFVRDVVPGDWRTYQFVLAGRLDGS